jgi:3',5'-cyclic AMP phosphodiesterase CpdA
MSDFMLVHFTDPHITHPGGLLKNGIDANTRLQLAIRRLLALRITPQAAIFTGDLVDRGDLIEYETLEQLIQPLRERMPVYLLIGNHDHRERFKAATHPPPRRANETEQNWVQFSASLTPGHRLIALDSVKHGQDEGVLCDARLAWLEQMLDEYANEQIVLAVHHPPFKSGNERFDGIGLTNVPALQMRIRPRQNIRLVICGHLHRAVSATIGHIPVVAAPSTAHPYGIDHATGFKRDPNDELPGFSLHRLMADQGWVSHHVWFDPHKTT